MYKYVVLLLLLLSSEELSAQEWKNYKRYRESTGLDTIKQGHWITKDRRRNTTRWQQANVFNLKMANGQDRYKTIRQRRDFYQWFESYTRQQGHKLGWTGAAIIVTKRLAYTDSKLARGIIFRDKALVKFFNEVNKKIFDHAFQQFLPVIESHELYIGQKAAVWDSTIQYEEQYVVAQPIYEKLSPALLNKYQRMAAGKGIYRFGSNKQIRFKGQVDNPKDRYDHGMTVVIPYYKNYKK